MDIIETEIPDLLIIKPKIFNDKRGCFFESYNERRYLEDNIPYKFVQDNYSYSKKGVLRGLHFQKNQPQGKLVSVIHGKVLDVAVDLRVKSKTFGKHTSLILSDKNNLQFFIPPGFAHGFLVLSETAKFFYKCTDYYDASDEGGLIWNDNDLSIDWGTTSPNISEKDSKLQSFANYRQLNE